mmetsp:Transcript_27688/g.88874  ORF Transcript_27688/g.88874 Transcript_27688/m.88874 type:complete len:290 (-) Transcript_27688:200-1069(-)
MRVSRRARAYAIVGIVHRAAASDTLHICTAGNQPFFSRIQNIVGSIHVWMAATPVIVVDLGLDGQQRAAVQHWRRTRLRSFDFARYPPHVRDLGNYAWKPLLMRELLQEHAYIFYADPSVELRQPITATIEASIRAKGYWYVHQEGKSTRGRCCGAVLELTHPATISALNATHEGLKNSFMCAGGIQGYARSGSAVRDILDPTCRCALQRSCIAPPTSSRHNHRFDQSIFSILISQSAGRYTCERDQRFYNYKNYMPLTRNLTEASGVVLNMRRLDHCCPYAKHIQLRP